MTVRHTVKLAVNAHHHEVEVEPRVTLLDALRDEIGTTSVHAGCEHGVCGACTVLFDGEPIRSCLLFAVQAEGHTITTVESLGTPDEMHPVQETFRAAHGLQCGYCTPAMVLTVVDLLARDPHPSEAAVREAIAGNICRCTGYTGIVEGVLNLGRDDGQAPDSSA